MESIILVACNGEAVRQALERREWLPDFASWLRPIAPPVKCTIQNNNILLVPESQGRINLTGSQRRIDASYQRA